MKSNLVIFLFLSFLVTKGFSQSDCPSRAENEKFINDYINNDQGKGNRNAKNIEVNSQHQTLASKYEELEKSKCWHLEYTETWTWPNTNTNTFRNGFYKGGNDEHSSRDWSWHYSSQSECAKEIEDLESYTTANSPYLKIVINKNCLPCNTENKNSNLKNGKQGKEIPLTENKPLLGISQKALAEALTKNLPNIPCGTVIKNIKTLENGKYEIEIEQKQGSKTSPPDDNIALRKALDDFYVKLKVDFENKKQEQINLQQKANQDGQTKYTNLTETTESSKTSFSNCEGMLTPQEVFAQNSNLANQYGVKMPGENGEPDFIRVEGYHGNTVDFHYDENGSLFYYTVYNEDGSVITYYDTNENGLPDQQVTIIPGEQPQYLAIKENPGDNQGIMLNDNKETIDLGTPWETKTKKQIQAERIAMRDAQTQQYLNNQPRKPWESGYVFPLNPIDGVSKSEDKIKIYFLGGIGNTNLSLRNAGQSVSNARGQDTYAITSDFQEQNSEIGNITQPDVLKALDIVNGEKTIATEVGTYNMKEDLKAGYNVQIICHSRGCAETFNEIQNVQKEFNQKGMGDLMKNVQVITLGGFSPPPDKWNTQADIISVINPGDAVPEFRGNGSYWDIKKDIIFNTTNSHPLNNYLPWIEHYRKFGADDLLRNQYKTHAPPPTNK